MDTVNLISRVNDIKHVGEVIAESLAEMIYSAELKPGQQLPQEDIAHMFGVSRVPVRDAFQRLLNMGLVVNVPRRGIIVRPLSKKLLEELYSVREILEGSAIRIVIKKATPEFIATIEEMAHRHYDVLQNGDIKTGEKLDGEFHRTIFSITANQVLNNLIYSNWVQIKQARSASRIGVQYGKEWMDNSRARHKKIIEAIKSGDEELAYQVVVKNIIDSKQEVFEHLEELGVLE